MVIFEVQFIWQQMEGELERRDLDEQLCCMGSVRYSDDAIWSGEHPR